MKILIKFVFFAMLAFSQVSISAQEISKFEGTPVSVTVKLKVPEAKYLEYDTSGKAKRVFSNVTQVKALTAEELMQSMYSADNQKWINFNYYKPEEAIKFSKKDFKERANANIDTSYFELIHKLEFSHDGIPTAFVKYWFVKEARRVSLNSVMMQKIGDRWYLVNLPQFQNEKNLIGHIKSDVFAALYRGKGKKDDLLDQLITETRGVYNVLDFTKLTEIFIQWEKQNNLSMLRHFCDGY